MMAGMHWHVRFRHSPSSAWHNVHDEVQVTSLQPSQKSLQMMLARRVRMPSTKRWNLRNLTIKECYKRHNRQNAWGHTGLEHAGKHMRSRLPRWTLTSGIHILPLQALRSLCCFAWLMQSLPDEPLACKVAVTVNAQQAFTAGWLLFMSGLSGGRTEHEQPAPSC
jgi:hypothetical protein